MAPLKCMSTPVRGSSDSGATTAAPTPDSTKSGVSTRSGKNYPAPYGDGGRSSPAMHGPGPRLSPVPEAGDLANEGDEALDRAPGPLGGRRASSPVVVDDRSRSPVRSPVPETAETDLANEGDEALDRTTRQKKTKKDSGQGQFAWGDKLSRDRLRRTEAVIEAAIDSKAMLNERGEKEKRWRSVVTRLKEADLHDKNGVHLFAALQPDTIESANGVVRKTASHKTVAQFFDTVYEGWVKHTELQRHTSGNFAEMPYFDVFGNMENSLVTSMEIIHQSKKDHEEAVATRTTATPSRRMLHEFSRRVSTADLQRTRRAADNIRDAGGDEDVNSYEEDGSGEDDEDLPPFRPPKKKRRGPQRKNDLTESFQTTLVEMSEEKSKTEARRVDVEERRAATEERAAERAAATEERRAEAEARRLESEARRMDLDERRIALEESALAANREQMQLQSQTQLAMLEAIKNITQQQQQPMMHANTGSRQYGNYNHSDRNNPNFAA